MLAPKGRFATGAGVPLPGPAPDDVRVAYTPGFDLPVFSPENTLPRSQRSAPAVLPFHSWLTIWVKSWEMALAAPIVISNRLTRMAVAGPSPGQRDRTEVLRMGQEKFDASGESMRAAVTGICDANQQLFRILARSAWTGVAPGWAPAHDLMASWFETLEQSVSPFHRRVMSNEVRLKH